MEVKTKDMFEDLGEVKKIDISGMAVFDMPLLGKDGKPTKKTEEMKLAVKCEKGDRVVRVKSDANKRKLLFVIPAKEWAEMPADEETYKKQTAAAATPQLAIMQAQIEELQAKLAASAGAGA
jgi:formylmethanofuran dehydrogenase subunit D